MSAHGFCEILECAHVNIGALIMKDFDYVVRTLLSAAFASEFGFDLALVGRSTPTAADKSVRPTFARNVAVIFKRPHTDSSLLISNFLSSPVSAPIPATTFIPFIK